jgi:hypothetical protein
MSIILHTRLPCSWHVSRQSSTASVTQSTLPHPRASVWPNCQPPQLNTRLLRSLSQVPVLILRHSRSISTNLYDLHFCHLPPYICSTPAHHKPTFMVSQHKTHAPVSPWLNLIRYPLTFTHHHPEPQGTSHIAFAISPLMSVLSTPPHEHKSLEKEEEKLTRMTKSHLKARIGHPEWAKLGPQREGATTQHN